MNSKEDCRQGHRCLVPPKQLNISLRLRKHKTLLMEAAVNTLSVTVRERTEAWKVPVLYLGKFLASQNKYCLEKQPLVVLSERASGDWPQNQHLHH